MDGVGERNCPGETLERARSAVVKAMRRDGTAESDAHGNGVGHGAGRTGASGPRVCPQEKRHLVLDLATGKSRPVIHRSPVLSSASSPWQGVSIEQHTGGPVESIDFAAPKHVIIVQLRQTAVCEFRNGSGGFHPVRLVPGTAVVLPAMVPHSVRTADSGEFIAVRLEPRFVVCAAHEMVLPGRFELQSAFGVDDPMLRAGALALKSEAESGFIGGRIYGESLASALAVHLVRHYGVRKQMAEATNGALSRIQMRRVIEFIHDHLTDDICLATLAKVAGLSQFHFARSFKNAAHMTPHQYVLRCRVERARELMLVHRTSMADVALKVGFCDQSHLAVHFKRVYGIPPKEFLRQIAAPGT